MRLTFIMAPALNVSLNLNIHEVRAFYLNGFTSIHGPWSPRWLARKHYRIELFNGRFLR